MMPAEVLCMQLTSPTYLVVGLSDGTFAGWDLQSDQISILPAHNSPITSIMLHDQFLVSGDASGILKMFDTTKGFCIVLEGKTNYQQHSPSIQSLLVINKHDT
jgi:WD40 repeat protein